jgi:hypothetical protein
VYWCQVELLGQDEEEASKGLLKLYRLATHPPGRDATARILARYGVDILLGYDRTRWSNAV